MGTRGLCGFVSDGQVYAHYHHSDSYPSYLGRQVINAAIDIESNFDIQTVKDRINSINLIDDESDIPSDEELREIAEIIDPDLMVSSQSEEDWYCVLRNAQGNFKIYYEDGLRFMIDGSGFAQDSLFCEYGYFINLDDKTIEFYRGFIKEPHDDGRFSHHPPQDSYYPIRLIDTLPFDIISECPGESIDEIISFWENDRTHKGVETAVYDEERYL